MRDLRRRALESNKTVSRKTASRIASGATSKAGSAAASPAQSRATSRTRGKPTSDEEDEEEYFSDSTAWSTNSIDGVLNSEEIEMSEEAWRAELYTRIEQISNTKRSSTDGRIQSLSVYAHILMSRYARRDVESHLTELVPSLIKSIRQDTSEREALIALTALCVTIVTLESVDIYDDVANQLKRSIQSSESIEIKTSAIHALGTAAFFGGAGEDEKLDIMALFLEIIESDGGSVEAQDDGGVVTAALQQWGLLATEIEDLQDETEAAMEAFVDQLDSADSKVQIAAGENIAFLYEKSYTPQEEDEAGSEKDDSEDPSEDPEYNPSAIRMVKRYNVYRRPDQLRRTLEELAKTSSRRVSKRDKRSLHSSFAEIRNTVEKPTRGPGYSTAIDQETGRVYGNRGKMKLDSEDVTIDRWWKLLRLNVLRRVLQGGLSEHYSQNSMVSHALRD